MSQFSDQLETLFTKVCNTIKHLNQMLLLVLFSDWNLTYLGTCKKLSLLSFCAKTEDTYLFTFRNNQTITFYQLLSNFEFLSKLIVFKVRLRTTPDFPFVLNWSLMGLFIMPSYGNVQFAADINIVKTIIYVVPFINIYNCLNINELWWKLSMKPNLPIHFRARYKWIHFQLLRSARFLECMWWFQCLCQN